MLVFGCAHFVACGFHFVATRVELLGNKDFSLSPKEEVLWEKRIKMCLSVFFFLKAKTLGFRIRICRLQVKTCATCKASTMQSLQWLLSDMVTLHQSLGRRKYM